jgi:hypothetical protein
MSVNLKISFDINLITNSSYTKFLRVTMGNTLSWNSHIDLFMKKLSTASYIIRNAKTHMSASSLKMIYHAFFHSAVIYGLYFGEACHIVPQFLACNKWQLELWIDVRIQFHVEIHLRNYKFCLWHHKICYLY